MALPRGGHGRHAPLHEEDAHGRKLSMSRMALADVKRHSDAEFPYLLAHGRVLHDADRTMEIGTVKKKSVIVRDEVIEIHESDAGSMGVADGDWARVVSERAAVDGVVRLTSPLQGMVSTTSLFGQMITDLERSRDPAPMLGVDGLPLVPVRVEKIEPARPTESLLPWWEKARACPEPGSPELVEGSKA